MWCASLPLFDNLRLHYLADDLGKDRFKQGKFVGQDGIASRSDLELNLDSRGFVRSFRHLLSCMYVPARSDPIRLLQCFFQFLFESVSTKLVQ